jgi:hypothetical protein
MSLVKKPLLGEVGEFAQKTWLKTKPTFCAKRHAKNDNENFAEFFM